MKIKQDFITNSSSTSYIICVPKNFDLESVLAKDLDPTNCEDDSNLLQAIQMLVSDHSLIEYDNFDTFRDVCDRIKDFVISSFDTESDRGEIQLLYLEDIQDQITNKVKEHENQK